MGGNLVLYESMKKYERDFGSNSNYGCSSFWTLTENKIFEKALAMYDSKTPDRWQKIVAMLPGKTPSDAYKHYQVLEADVNCIEAGLVDIPSYSTSTFTLELGDDRDGFKRTVKGCEQERKKGVPWTEEEHRLFLLGLEKYGKGDWRSISRNLVVTKTPTQVASHAQKYFIRLSSGSKDRRRSSIHDITTANVSDKRLPSLARSSGLATQSSSCSTPSTSSSFSLLFDSNQTSEGAIFENSGACLSQGSFSVPSYAVGAYANNFGTQYFQRNMLHDSHLVHNSALQMQPAIHSYQGLRVRRWIVLQFKNQVPQCLQIYGFQVGKCHIIETKSFSCKFSWRLTSADALLKVCEHRGDLILGSGFFCREETVA